VTFQNICVIYAVLYLYAIANGDGHPVGMAVAYFITDTVIANLVEPNILEP